MKRKLFAFMVVCLTILTISLFPGCDGGSGSDSGSSNESTVSGSGK